MSKAERAAAKADAEAALAHRERVRELRRLGFDEIDALKIAESGASLSFIRETLLGRGATHAQALRIAT